MSRALVGATLAAALTVLPAAVRCSSAVPAAVAWLTLWGLLACVAGPAATFLLASRPLPRRTWAVPLGALFALPWLTLFGRILHRSTHHRPLGAATFAMLGGAFFLGCVVIAMRLIALSEAGRKSRRLAIAAIVVLGVLAMTLELGLVRAGVVHAGGDHPGELLVDGASFLVTIACGVWLPVQIVRVPRWLGPAVWLVMVGVSVTLVTALPAVRVAVSTRAPVLAACAAGLLER